MTTALQPIEANAMIVITAATPWESRPLQSCWNLSSNNETIYQGQVGRHKVLVIETGIGASKTHRALRRLPGLDNPLIVISSGLAGALQPGIRTGDLVADMREVPVEFLELARQTAERTGTPLNLGNFLSADRVLWDPAEKIEAGLKERAIAVDMESAAVRDWCKEHGGTFIGIRAVLDTVDQRLPQDMYDGNGSFQDMTRYALRNWKELPLLLGLGIKQQRAMSRLSRFMDAFLKEL